MSVDTINIYKVLNNNTDIKNDNECSICLELINKKDRQTMVCGHKFHKNCIKTWINIKNICPLCRYEYEPFYKCFDCFHAINV